MTDPSHRITHLLGTYRARMEEFEQMKRSGSEYSFGISAGRAALAAKDLIDALGLHAYAVDPITDDRLEQVVFSVHGVEVSVRGRTYDLFVHIDDARDDEPRGEHPLVVQVGEGHESEYA